MKVDMSVSLRTPIAAAIFLLGVSSNVHATGGNDADAVTQQLKNNIDTIVVIYTENRAFDNLYGKFPGADGVENALKDPSLYLQVDRNGSVLPELPTVWSLAGHKSPVGGDWKWIKGLPNKPFEITAEKLGVQDPLTAVGPDLVHRFYNHQVQINGGRNNKFAAYSNAGGLPMGYYDGSSMRMWKLAQQYTLSDQFFQGTYGSSFQNHQYLVCLCTPQWVEDANFPKEQISVLDKTITAETGIPTLALTNPGTSALNSPPKYVSDGNISPKIDGKYYAVNTSRPSFQPSGTPPPTKDKNSVQWLLAQADGDPKSKTRGKTVPLPPLTETTIGDRLSEEGVTWKWYSGGWNLALANYSTIWEKPYLFQPQHQPFNYYNRFTPETAQGKKERAEHLQDYENLLSDAKAGNLPQVVFYKPAGIFNQHAYQGTIRDGDEHIANVIEKLQASPQWEKMAIIVTFDESGGWFDHVKPPKGDYWGPGNRVATIIISPHAKKGYVDHTAYDPGSIHQFISRRFGNEMLPNVRKQFGDLTNAFSF